MVLLRVVRYRVRKFHAGTDSAAAPEDGERTAAAEAPGGHRSNGQFAAASIN
jgi:hypothetical protein